MTITVNADNDAPSAQSAGADDGGRGDFENDDVSPWRATGSTWTTTRRPEPDLHLERRQFGDGTPGEAGSFRRQRHPARRSGVDVDGCRW